MQPSDDMELLREYATRGSDPAFEALVRRHINLIYSVALRRLRDPAAAGEVAQTVFIILARKAKSLPPTTVLSGWLYRTAQLTAGHAARADRRRRDHENEAAQMRQHSESTEQVWKQLAPVLEDAMAHLREADRNAVVLRYFENKDFREVAAALGTNADTAQKRTSRAVEKLRAYFVRRGVAIPADAFTAALSAGAVQSAPSDVLEVAVASHGISHSTSTATLAKSTLKVMTLTKIATGGAIAVAALLLAAGGVEMVRISRPLDLSWRIAQPTELAFTNARPQVTILPTKFGPPNNWRIILAPDGRCMGIAMTPEQIIQTAFGQSPDGVGQSIVKDPVITILDATLPANEYDFISSLPTDTTNALQKAVMKQFSVRPDYEMIETNVYVLSVQHPEPTKLKSLPPWHPSPKWPHQPHPGDSMKEFAGTLQARLNIPVNDETGLTNYFRFNFTWPRKFPEIPSLEELNKTLMDQLGLQLKPDVRTVKVFVIKHAD